MSTRLPAKSSTPASRDIKAAAAKERAALEQEHVPRPFLFLFGVTGLLVALLVKPYAVPLFLAATLAVTAYPAHQSLQRRYKWKPTMAAAMSTLVLFALVIAPLVSLAAYSAGAIGDGVVWLKEHVTQEHLQQMSEGKVPGPLRPVIQRSLSKLNITPEDIEAYSGKATKFLQEVSPKVAAASVAVATNLVFVLFAFFFFIKDGPQLSRHLFGLLPLKKNHTARLFDDFASVSSASMIGVMFTAVGQALVLSVGFWAAGLPHVFFLAVLAFVSAFIPLVGSALVWVPAVLGAGMYFSGKAAAGLAVWSIVSVQVIDAVLKPMVLKGRITMHGALMFIGMLGGLSLFGGVGFIAGPMCIAFFLSFLSMYERDYQF